VVHWRHNIYLQRARHVIEIKCLFRPNIATLLCNNILFRPELHLCKLNTIICKQTEGVYPVCRVPDRQMSASLPSARQHISYVYCPQLRREYYPKCSVLVCVTQCSQSAAQHTHVSTFYTYILLRW